MEPKQSTLFFIIQISSIIVEEEVEQAFLSLGDVSIEAWQEWEAKSFFKEVFSFELQSNSFEINTILFFSKYCSLLKQNLVLKTKPHFSPNKDQNYFYSSKIHFLSRQGQVENSMSPFH